MNQGRPKHPRRRLRPLTAVLGLCALAATLLLWTKLRLVNGLPRTAVAEPMPEAGNSQGNTAVPERAALPRADEPPTPNEDWTKGDRIPPFE